MYRSRCRIQVSPLAARIKYHNLETKLIHDMNEMTGQLPTDPLSSQSMRTEPILRICPGDGPSEMRKP